MDELTETDGRYLRQAIALSALGSARGNRPFGAVVVSADGQLLAEAHNDNAATGDCTAHAEVNALRQLRREAMVGATIYASGEPCVMCAGAIFWSGIRRVVFGIDAVRLRRFRAKDAAAADLQMSCRDVFAHSAEPFTVIGPALLAEATAPHQAYWGME
ncbi:nucleoside deaminase [Pseudorhodoferax sp. Leaf265]|jgi:tRNA(Arg) A34 adenosine deaminase TadA|uniref:nucleoside deaminase n=1 Tax=Pseudorhodoferax sp. Leaf265 TaxID=1736315 RepID=UPI0006F2937B|nr:nucleoside deaminase [Pseudorhodoferax sp. Leaf265]KQP02387.1 CMP deaminase [Pseudorhodoferax sp. Leaf265]PZP96953.1 MAG: nucleoside deaminase [Variovorax paradoxus]PZQ08089.1 MAG: nucleoside deaminase [Variovorax paradoxus]